MTRRDKIENEYYKWLSHRIGGDIYDGVVSYEKLLMALHNKPFRWDIPRDENRYEDGLSLRYRFILNTDHEEYEVEYIEGPCSVLEMMTALAIHCEENIMDDPAIGDRTSQWFWGMINSLGLSSMDDKHFDKGFVDDILERFLDREYEPNGKGGLFTIKNIDCDLTLVEIWHQLCWYLDNFV